jgi:hypothetical protein
MAESGLENRIREWLTKEGYPLEMRCAKIFEDLGFSISLGQYYRDPETGKSRELDVVAAIRSPKEVNEFEVVLKFLVQCKSSKAKTMVVFST